MRIVKCEVEIERIGICYFILTGNGTCHFDLLYQHGGTTVL